MKRSFLTIFLALLATWMALPISNAWAVDDTKYPSVIIDQSCTDLFDVPAAFTPPIAHTGTVFNVTPQISGSADTFCDHDSRIKTGAITSSLNNFGPLMLLPGASGYLVFVDVNTSVGGDLGFVMKLIAYKPHDGATQVISFTAEDNGNGDYLYYFGTNSTYANSPGTELDTVMPAQFYIQVAMSGATSLTIDMSILAFY